MERSFLKVVRCSLIALVFGASLLPAGQVRAESPSMNVLVIYSAPRGGTATDDFHAAFIRSIRAASPDMHIEVNSETFEVVAGRGPNYEQAMSEYLRQKYSGIRIDVIVGVSASAIRLVSKLRDDVFPDASIVFGAVDRRVLEEGPALPGAVGVTAFVDIQGTIRAALGCRPGTRHVALVSGSSQIELAWRDRTRSEIAAVDPELDQIDLVGLDVDELLEKLAALPKDTVVLWADFLRDSKGSVTSPNDVLQRANEVTAAPLFGIYDHFLGDGIVGGSLASYARAGSQTGDVVLRKIRGELEGSERVVAVTENALAFDARELDRWGIPESRLPAGSVVRFREPTIWQLYGNYLAIGFAVVLFQALLIAGLLVQRSSRLSAQRANAQQLKFERLQAELSNRFSDVPAADVGSVIEKAMEEARAQLGADRMSLVQFGSERASATVRYGATVEGLSRPGEAFNLDDFPELIARVKGGKAVRVEHLDSVETRTTPSHTLLARAGVVSVAAVPMHIGGEVIGVLGVASLRRESTWSNDQIGRLRFIADIFTNALGRRNAEEKVRRSEELSHAVLESIAAQVCVIDRESRVVAGNEAWRKSWLHTDDVACSLMRRSCGEACSRPASCTSTEAVQARNGIRGVIAGDLPTFSLEYRRPDEADSEWYVMTAERLQLPEGGAVVSNQNVTARKRAELEAEQRRQELTHFSRVSAMGELAASLAHELNQPLTGVLTNAQAAVRYLDADPPDVGEVREILGDIIEDDRRAGEVIRRLRAMLQSGRVEPSDLNLNEVVGTVLKFVASDAIIKDVSIETKLTQPLAPVSGDRIQLQQVVLNLVTNAMDAVREHPVRTVTVQTHQTDGGGVRLSVSDVGHGIDPDKLDTVFTPFYTTKSEGLGMGLSIARTIIEAHGGTLWAENNPGQGASFLFSIPSSRSMSA